MTTTATLKQQPETPTETPTVTRADHFAAIDKIRSRLNEALKGKKDVVDLVLVCLISQGHLLLEDKPGLGKTTLAKSLASAIGGVFARAQCTPDLLPSDITGFNVFNQKSHEFEFRRGPVFGDVLLADEINRATPRTQSALLEAMAERQVTVDTERFELSGQFFVIATQNPVDQHGTYPLPEAQLDRFAMKLSVGYPAADDEIQMLQEAVGESSFETKISDSLLQPNQLAQIQRQVRAVQVAESVQDYLVRLAAKTREHLSIRMGLSPRGLLTLQRTAQARAWLSHRNYMTPDDVLDVVFPVLGVRLGLETNEANRVIQEVLDAVAVPDYSEKSK